MAGTAPLGMAAHAHFLCIGGETGKRTVFGVKNPVFIGNFADLGAGNEAPQDYVYIA
jgi:hypothetical protein